MAAVLPAIVDILIGLALSLRSRDTTTTVALVPTLVTRVLLALRNSFVAPVGDMPLLLLATIVVVSARHGDLLCQMHMRAVIMNVCSMALVHRQANVMASRLS